MHANPVGDHPRYGLGRIQNHDYRNWEYPVRLSWVTETKKTPITRNWNYYGPKLDQWKIGACTGFQGAQALNCNGLHYPGRQMHAANGYSFYSFATARDRYPGAWIFDGFNDAGRPKWHGQDTGSDAGAVGSVLIERGLITSWRWARGVDGAIEALQDGPVGFGSVWTEDMYEPNKYGFVRPTGRVVGGHQYLITGWNSKKRVFKALNSWGEQWGIRGYFYITEHDARELIDRREGDVVQYERSA